MKTGEKAPRMAAAPFPCHSTNSLQFVSGGLTQGAYRLLVSLHLKYLSADLAAVLPHRLLTGRRVIVRQQLQQTPGRLRREIR